MAERQLTELQERFLDLLFSDEYLNRPREAATAAGYSPKSPLFIIMRGVKDVIVGRIESYLMFNAPKSVKSIVDVLDNPHQVGAKTKLDAAAMLLDRAGIVKRERIEVDVKSTNSVLILPSKKET
jgi:hypothetical protein